MLCQVLLGFTVLCVAGEVFWGRMLVGLPGSRWLRGVVIPCVACAAMVILPGLLAQAILASVDATVRFLVISGVVTVLTLAGGFVVLDRQERDGLLRQVKRCRTRVSGR